GGEVEGGGAGDVAEDAHDAHRVGDAADAEVVGVGEGAAAQDGAEYRQADHIVARAVVHLDVQVPIRAGRGIPDGAAQDGIESVYGFHLDGQALALLEVARQGVRHHVNEVAAAEADAGDASGGGGDAVGNHRDVAGAVVEDVDEVAGVELGGAHGVDRQGG